ncbi:MAG TPA: hypothetical protein VFU15_06725 [Bacteroidia bacterium]|nr:hypothetical protein [Bacteroidia bacterium]
MNEPKHAHFILSDGQYCHILGDKLIIAKKEIPEKLPASSDSPDMVSVALETGGMLILAFLLYMTILASAFTLSALISGLFLLLAFSLVRQFSFSNAKVILRANILGVEYHRRAIGYDYFIVIYSGEKGKLCRRRMAIYDSSQCLEQALISMKSEGLLK